MTHPFPPAQAAGHSALGVRIPLTLGLATIGAFIFTLLTGAFTLGTQSATQTANNTALNLRIDRLADTLKDQSAQSATDALRINQLADRLLKIERVPETLSDQRAQVASDEAVLRQLNDRLIKLESQYTFILTSQASPSSSSSSPSPAPRR